MADATQPSESKALRLARYLKEFVGLRTTTIYNVNKYESVLWFGDIPQEPECQSPAWNADGSMDPNGPGFQKVNGIPYYLNGVWWDEMSRLYARMRASGRLDLLDHHLAGDALDITQFAPQPKKK